MKLQDLTSDKDEISERYSIMENKYEEMFLKKITMYQSQIESLKLQIYTMINNKNILILLLNKYTDKYASIFQSEIQRYDNTNQQFIEMYTLFSIQIDEIKILKQDYNRLELYNKKMYTNFSKSTFNVLQLYIILYFHFYTGKLLSPKAIINTINIVDTIEQDRQNSVLNDRVIELESILKEYKGTVPYNVQDLLQEVYDMKKRNSDLCVRCDFISFIFYYFFYIIFIILFLL